MQGDVLLRDSHSAGARGRRMICIGRRLLAVVAAAVVSANSLTLLPAVAQVRTNWISSWTASPQAPRGVIPASFSNRTICQIVHLSVGGDKVRVRLSNEFGARPVLIGAASVAMSGGGSDISPGSLRPLTFGGSRSVIIPPGAPALSDPVDLNAAALSDVAVSLYLPGATDLGTVHQTGLQTAYASAAGDFTASSEFPVVDRFANRFFVSAILVEPRSPARAIVAFGDFDHRRHQLDRQCQCALARCAGTSFERSRSRCCGAEPGHCRQSRPERRRRHQRTCPISSATC